MCREGVTAVEEPENCPNVSRISCKYASIFQEFLQLSSLPIWNRFKNVGFWRQLTVRLTLGGLKDLRNIISVADNRPVYFLLTILFCKPWKVREGRTPGKLIDSDNSDGNISEVMIIVQVNV